MGPAKNPASAVALGKSFSTPPFSSSFYFYFHVKTLSYYSLALFKTLILLLAGKREKNLL